MAQNLSDIRFRDQRGATEVRHKNRPTTIAQLLISETFCWVSLIDK